MENENAAAEEAVKTEGNEAPEKTVFEILKEKSVTPNSNQPAFEEKLSPETEAKIAKLQELEDFKKSVEGNPLYQTLNYSGDPEKLRQVAKEIVGDDYSNYSYEQLVRLDLQKQGLSGDNLEDAVLDSMTEYQNEEVPKWKKDLKYNELKSKFNSKAGESKVFQQLKEAFQASQPKQLSPQEINAIKAHDLASIEAAVNEFKAAGVEINAESIKSHYNEKSIVPYLNEKGELDAKKMTYDKFILDNIDTIIKNEREAAVKEYKKKNAGLDRTTDAGAAAGDQPDKDREKKIRLGINPNLIGLKPEVID